METQNYLGNQSLPNKFRKNLYIYFLLFCSLLLINSCRDKGSHAVPPTPSTDKGLKGIDTPAAENEMPPLYEEIPLVGGGRNARIDEAPWQVGIYYVTEERLKCGGSIVDKEWILTACHCVRKGNGDKIDKNNLLIFHSTIDSRTFIQPQKGVKIDTIIEHPSYLHDSLDNDIALIKLSKPIKLKYPFPQSIKFADQLSIEKLTENKATLKITGWGQTGKDKATSEQQILQIAEINFIEISQCKLAIENVKNKTHDIRKFMLCAGDRIGTRGSCIGDSGGPLVYQKDIIVGICSWGLDRCGLASNYGIYTDATNQAYITWIEDTKKQSNFHDNFFSFFKMDFNNFFHIK